MNTVLEFHVLCWMKSKSKIRKRDELLSVEQESNVRAGNCWLATHGLGFPELLAFSDHHQLYIFFLFCLLLFHCNFRGELVIWSSYSNQCLNPDFAAQLAVWCWANNLTSKPQFPPLKNIGTSPSHCEIDVRYIGVSTVIGVYKGLHN